MQPELMAYWCKLLENLQFSPLEFYDIVQEAIEHRQVPSLKVEHVEIKESGVLSANRTYLRLSRERFYFDICGAPFGTGFFVSTRLLYKTARITIVHIVALVLFLYVIWELSTNNFGMVQGGIYCVGGLLSLVLLMFIAKSSPGFSSFFVVLPIVGDFFERFFCPMTYYKIDLITMYQEAVHSAVIEAVSQITQSKGVKPLSELERKPTIHGFFKR